MVLKERSKQLSTPRHCGLADPCTASPQRAPDNLWNRPVRLSVFCIQNQIILRPFFSGSLISKYLKCQILTSTNESKPTPNKPQTQQYFKTNSKQSWPSWPSWQGQRGAWSRRGAWSEPRGKKRLVCLGFSRAFLGFSKVF